MPTDTVTNRYGAIAAEIYDIDKPCFALPDTAFHLERFQGFARPILEPACGSGRTLLPFLQAGLDIAGFDPSPEMLARARDRCAEAGFAADLAKARYDDFAYDRRFGAILIPVGSFTLIDDFAAALATLRRFREHLEPGGVLVIDLQGLNFLAGGQPDRRRWTAPSGDLLTCEGIRTATDWLRQRAETTYRYERWRDGTLVESQIDVMAQRYWGLDEFRLALEAAGFSGVTACGGYDRRRGPRAADRVWTFEALA
ncbi:MAG: class I SAM-dependent methyltransferase [Phenylobacterium sp.]|uniref:class I SAM-dependent DNA methyltransferase n=1 Tax=Phenylobacterium sp. TaxID=1871053 RepID=UPI001A58F728|nr:class I SAM-dependent methyltransferase [Phenylobacterium sp.]MBL8553234.1 class I SAM-dependent methyltransferase [Phenylobacterium sp.]